MKQNKKFIISKFNEIPIEKYTAAKKGGKWGFINVDGKIIIPFKYARALGFDGESAWVSLTDREDDEGFYIDKDGNKVE